MERQLKLLKNGQGLLIPPEICVSPFVRVKEMSRYRRRERENLVVEKGKRVKGKVVKLCS